MAGIRKVPDLDLADEKGAGANPARAPDARLRALSDGAAPRSLEAILAKLDPPKPAAPLPAGAGPSSGRYRRCGDDGDWEIEVQ